MKKQFFSNEKDGFYGTYYENPKGANCAMIGLFGDDPNDFMAKCGAKWLHKNGVNVMCMSPDVKNYGHVNFPLERIENAIKWLKSHGNKKIGIMGMSTAGMDSLVAASYFPDITLTFGLTPSDFVWQGFEQGEKGGCKEWPIPDASTLSWQGKPLAYMPFVYAHPEYYHKIEEETKGSGDITRSTHLFIDSEKAREHTEEEMIKVENIKGKLIMVGADDDSFWEAGKYVRRMDKRLKERPHECDYEALTYEHGTHFVLPETMLRKALPVGLKFVMKFIFKAAKDYPKECEQTRKDIDRRLSAALKQWVAE
ncbi:MULTISPECIES: acyl-CoA thioester hydrolase/BAAT C-terminal domain-containing protein [Ruminococcus]|uniref:acyl-CoA thioester hydrolase/BAAT C-terminal domain-containing protein n=1 Tax=Ruminococcus TaxID=1263 RepID=UPI002E77A0D3|nr:acyl-CoA thioester hydrolase/BAAT C-terminal domain-containing protein [Ruminococcus sp.]MEE0047459.1 acyl-CoA thioester hydrolase/BAAT C-terminal domain-containing protein [Ruminococcus sp.]